jgi:hypothetical protein
MQAVSFGAAATAAVTLLSGAGCGSGGGGGAPGDSAASSSAPAPAGTTPTATRRISGVTFDWASHRREAHGSDNWPVTWSDDDHQYALFGDGGGFSGDNEDGRASFGVARIEGTHDSYRGVNRFGGKARECPSHIVGKGHGAPISIGGVLYAWITPRSDTHGYQSFVLHKSTDKGCRWRRLGVRFVRANDGFSYGTFVQAGKDNAHAPDPYVYSIATEVTNTDAVHVVQRPGRIVLIRAPINAMEDRTAYEVYAGIDAAGQPTWSADLADKVPIYEDPAGVGPFPQMSYVPGLHRYVYTNQHGDGVSIDAAKSLLTMAEAPHPWGPWDVFHRSLFFPQVERTVFQWNFAPKWFRDGGRNFTLVFSGNDANDSWNTVDGSFAVAE